MKQMRLHGLYGTDCNDCNDIGEVSSSYLTAEHKQLPWNLWSMLSIAHVKGPDPIISMFSEHTSTSNP
jgi:hypothetical protein